MSQTNWVTQILGASVYDAKDSINRQVDIVRLHILREYEAKHMQRVTVLRMIDRQIRKVTK